MERKLFPGLLVTGKTYPVRRGFRALDCRFDRDLGGYVCSLKVEGKAMALVREHGLHSELVDNLDYDPAVPETDDQRYERRKSARLRRADRLESQAATRERDAKAARARHRPYTSDYSFITQPILVGHHSQKRHEKLWDRIDSARDAEMRNAVEAEKLKNRAEHLRAVDLPRKGDAEAKYQARREAAEAQGIRKNSIIKCAMYGQGKVTKVNALTYTVRFDRGFSQAIDKGWAELIRHDDTPEAAPAWKKGDRVLAQVGIGMYGPGRPATVQRKTARGWSILVDGERETRSVDESDLKPMPPPTPEPPDDGAFHPECVRIDRYRPSCTQGEVVLFYGSRKLGRFGDQIMLVADKTSRDGWTKTTPAPGTGAEVIGGWCGLPDPHWMEVAERLVLEAAE